MAVSVRSGFLLELVRRQATQFHPDLSPLQDVVPPCRILEPINGLVVPGFPRPTPCSTPCRVTSGPRMNLRTFSLDVLSLAQLSHGDLDTRLDVDPRLVPSSDHLLRVMFSASVIDIVPPPIEVTAVLALDLQLSEQNRLRIVQPVLIAQKITARWIDVGTIVFLVVVTIFFLALTGGLSSFVTAATVVGVAAGVSVAVGGFLGGLLGGLIAAVQAILGGTLTGRLGALAQPLPESLAPFFVFLPTHVTVDDLVMDGTLSPEYDTRRFRVFSAVHRLSPGQGVDLDSNVVLTDSDPAFRTDADVQWSAGVFRSVGVADYGLYASRQPLELSLELARTLLYRSDGFLRGDRVPVFSQQPPIAGPEAEMPLVQCIRTSSGRYARCQLWRQSGEDLWLRYDLFESDAPTISISQSESIVEQRELSRSEFDWLARARREFAVAREVRLVFGSEGLLGPVRWEFEVARSPLRAESTQPLSTGSVRVQAFGSIVVLRSTVGGSGRIHVGARAIGADGIDLARTVAVDFDGLVRREDDAAPLQGRLRALDRSIVEAAINASPVPVAPDPVLHRVDPSDVVSSSGLPWLDPRALKRR
ncbi:MAG: hypothetical protein JNK05_15890 [Myxococcales bacterium]|nr:hypothetical protein [Myxococcales bacterium]